MAAKSQLRLAGRFLGGGSSQGRKWICRSRKLSPDHLFGLCMILSNLCIILSRSFLGKQGERGGKNRKPEGGNSPAGSQRRREKSRGHECLVGTPRLRGPQTCGADAIPMIRGQSAGRLRRRFGSFQRNNPTIFSIGADRERPPVFSPRLCAFV